MIEQAYEQLPTLVVNRLSENDDRKVLMELLHRGMKEDRRKMISLLSWIRDPKKGIGDTEIPTFAIALLQRELTRKEILFILKFGDLLDVARILAWSKNLFGRDYRLSGRVLFAFSTKINMSNEVEILANKTKRIPWMIYDDSQIRSITIIDAMSIVYRNLEEDKKELQKYLYQRYTKRNFNYVPTTPIALRQRAFFRGETSIVPPGITLDQLVSKKVKISSSSLDRSNVGDISKNLRALLSKTTLEELEQVITKKDWTKLDPVHFMLAYKAIRQEEIIENKEQILDCLSYMYRQICKRYNRFLFIADVRDHMNRQIGSTDLTYKQVALCMAATNGDMIPTTCGLLKVDNRIEFALFGEIERPDIIDLDFVEGFNKKAFLLTNRRNGVLFPNYIDISVPNTREIYKKIEEGIGFKTEKITNLSGIFSYYKFHQSFVPPT